MAPKHNIEQKYVKLKKKCQIVLSISFGFIHNKSINSLRIRNSERQVLKAHSMKCINRNRIK